MKFVSEYDRISEKEIEKMTLKRETRLGAITISDNVIGRVILGAAAKADGKFFLSSDKGKIIGVASRVGIGDISGNFSITESGGTYYIEFFGIISFGSSIRNVTETVLASVQKEMQSLFPDNAGVITLHIVGMKSRQIAERNIEVKREYEAAR